MRGLPIRLRVALTFAAAMAVVLIGLGAFLYLRLELALDESIDNALRARAGEVSVGGLEGAATLIERDETLAQVLTPGGEVLDATAGLSRAPLVDPRGLSGPRFEEAGVVAPLESRVRLLTAPCDEVVVVVGTSLGDRDEALSRLLTLLLIGGPGGLALASLAGYWVAGRALRPVEAMRRRAAELSASRPGERLPVPAADDELRRLGETLNAMLASLEAALERERRFVDDASHELRTPLSLFKTELELALRQGRTYDELRAAIVSSAEEADRLIELAEALLVVARAGDAVMRVDIEAEDLLGAVAERFRARAAETGRELAVDVAPGLVVSGDRLLLERALTGLVDNALRHGKGLVRLSACVGELSVADAGPGFPADFLPRAFERFSRADGARTGPGFGLGLAIVDTIARAHGGSARAEGAAVTIELPFTVVSRPLVQASEHDQEKEVHSSRTRSAGARGRR